MSTEFATSVKDPKNSEPHKINWQSHVAAARYFDRHLVEHCLLKDVPEGPSFEKLVNYPYIEELPGLPGYYEMEPSFRQSYFRSWWPEDTNEEQLRRIPRELRVLSCCLADAYAEIGDEREQLYHLIVGKPRQARTLFRQLYTEAEKRFDLTACHALLLTMEERQQLLAPSLIKDYREKRLRLKIRTQWSQEYYQTFDYLERQLTSELMPQLITGEPHWILHLYATGGIGKTSFIRAAISRYCVPRGIPCARLDFDDDDLLPLASEPWRLVLQIADQLKNQLPGPPFYTLLADYGDLLISRRGRSMEQTRAQPGPQEQSNLQNNILELFIQDFQVAHGPKPWVVIFDTLEELRLLKVDMRIGFALLEKLHESCPGLRLILAGRYHLGDPNESDPIARLAGFEERFGDQERSVELKPFTEEESRAYLLQMRAMEGDSRLEAIVEKTDGNPYKLARLSEIVESNPDLTSEAIAGFPAVDLIYVIDRVIQRIPNTAVRWLIRYGVIPRQLTFDFAEKVILPYLQKALKGDTTFDDPQADPLPKQDPKLDYFAANQTDVPLDLQATWQALTLYASPAGWVSTIPGNSLALSFQPDVVEPMRYLLREQAARDREIFTALNRDAVVYFESLAAKEPLQRAHWMQEALYHLFQLNDEEQIRSYWNKAVTAADPVTIRALAEEILRMPSAVERHTVEARPGSPTIPPDLRAQAAYELARQQLASPIGSLEWSAIRAWLAIMQPEEKAETPGLKFAQVAHIRGRVRLQDDKCESALEDSLRGLEEPAEPRNEMELHLLAADALLQLHGKLHSVESIKHYRSALALAEGFDLDRAVYIAMQLGHALESTERYPEAAELYRDWWDYAVRRNNLNEIAQHLHDQMRVHIAMGQEAEAVALGRSGLDVLIKAWRRADPEMKAAPSDTQILDPSWINILKAEVELADGRPNLALKSLFGTSPAAPVDLRDLSGNDLESLRLGDLEILSRIESARCAIDEAAMCYEKLAFRFYGLSTQPGLKALLDCAALFLDLAVNLQQADNYLADAEAHEVDLDASLGWSVRRQLLVIQRQAIQGKKDLAQQTVRQLIDMENRPPSTGTVEHQKHQALDWPDSLKAELAVEWVVQSEANPAALNHLSQILGEIQPPTRRLKLLTGLRRCTAHGRAAISLEQALRNLLPDVETAGQDPILGTLRLAEVERILGLTEHARDHLRAAEHLCQQPLRLAWLRQVYLAYDRLGWQEADLRSSEFPIDDDRLADESPELRGLFLLEHAERCVRFLGELEQASRLLARAAPLLGDHPQSPWNPRLSALRVAIVSAALLSGGVSSTSKFHRTLNEATPDLARLVLTFEKQLGEVSGQANIGDTELEERLAFALTPALNSFKAQGNEVGALQALDLILSAAERSKKAEQAKIAALAARIGRIFYEMAELDEAAAAFGEAVRRCPPDSPALPAYLNSLGVSLLGRYASSNSETDLETAHRFFEKAVNLTPSDSSLLARYLNNLGASHRNFFVRYGRTDDLQRAIDAFARSAESAKPASAEQAGALSNLSASLRDRYNQSGEIQDLEDAIRSLRKVVKLTPHDSSSLPGYLNNLAISLRARYECAGRKADLDEAVRLLRRVVKSTSTGALELAEYLNNLGVSLLARYALSGKLENLEEALTSFEQAVSLTAVGSTLLAGYLTNLGSSLNDHYARTGKLQDLEKAINTLRQAVEITPETSPTLTTCLNNLGRCLRDRFNRLNQSDDLEEAIAVFERAVKLTDPASPDLAAILNNLGQAYASRVVGDRAENIETALALYKRCLKRYTQDVYPSYWALTHNNLGQAYINRIRGKSNENLERAIEHYQLALQVRTRKSFPADWALTLSNLGSAYIERQSGDRRRNLKEASLCFEQALKVYTRKEYPEQWAVCQSSLKQVKAELQKRRAKSRVTSVRVVEMVGNIHVSQSIATVQGGKITGVRIESIGRESSDDDSLFSSVYDRLQEEKIAQTLGLQATHPQLREAVSNPGRLINIQTVSRSSWNVQLSTMKLEGDTTGITHRVELPQDLQSLVNLGSDESCSPAFIRQFASGWTSIAARLGELIFPKDVGEEYLKKESPYFLYWLPEVQQLGWLPWEMIRPGHNKPPLSVSHESPYMARRLGRSVVAPGFFPLTHLASSAVDILIVSPRRSLKMAAQKEGLLAEGPDLHRIYARHGASVEQLIQPSLAKLASAVKSFHPRVLHIVAELRARGSNQALDFGTEREDEGPEKQVSPRELANLLSKSEHPVVVVLDPPTPPWIHERLRQLCLRNAFASKLAALSSFPLGILATGLGDPQYQQPELANLLVKGLVERKALVEIAAQIRTAGKRILGNWDDSASLPPLEEVLPFLGTALFVDNALHGLEPATEDLE